MRAGVAGRRLAPHGLEDEPVRADSPQHAFGALQQTRRRQDRQRRGRERGELRDGRDASDRHASAASDRRRRPRGAGDARKQAGAGTAVTPPLIATVGPGFNISLTDSTGAPVSHLGPGTYTIQVSDKSDIHNFHLRGPGVDQATDVDTIGDTTWTVTFGNGRYTYLCDAHPTQMHRTFTSGVVPVTPKLIARVGPGKKISLRKSSGAKVTSLTAGPYKIVVGD